MEENLGLTVLVLPVDRPRVGADLRKSHLPVHALALAPHVAAPAAPEAVQLSPSVIRKAMPMERRRGSSYVSTVPCQKTEMLPLHRVQKTKGEEQRKPITPRDRGVVGFIRCLKNFFVVTYSIVLPLFPVP